MLLATGEALFGPEPHPWVRTGFLTIFFSLLLVAAYSAWALMVRSIIGFQTGFWTRVGSMTGNPGTIDTVARVAPTARKVGDVLIVAGWAVWTSGLAIAVPAMIRDGFFE
ncbi:MAG: hypothetical protein K5872_21135 [Rhizobiaceae bacterium]|nr:hypothetical protein [Rhizobiaceae bacterium]MCV0408722.1 hypothetical protein [Rhizobiaceae bacterium]